MALDTSSASAMNFLAIIFIIMSALWMVLAIQYACSVYIYLHMRSHGLLSEHSPSDPEYGRVYICQRPDSGESAPGPWYCTLYIPMGCIFRSLIHSAARTEEPRERLANAKVMTRKEHREAVDVLLHLAIQNREESRNHDDRLANLEEPCSESLNTIDSGTVKRKDDGSIKALDMHRPEQFDDIESGKDESDSSANFEAARMNDSSLHSANELLSVHDSTTRNLHLRQALEANSEDSDVRRSDGIDSVVLHPKDQQDKGTEEGCSSSKIETRGDDNCNHVGIERPLDMKYENDSSDSVSTYGLVCPICLSGLDLNDEMPGNIEPSPSVHTSTRNFVSSTCCHVFHHECILDWLSRPSTLECPCCRVPILDEIDIWNQVREQRRAKKKEACNKLRPASSRERFPSDANDERSLNSEGSDVNMANDLERGEAYQGHEGDLASV